MVDQPDWIHLNKQENNKNNGVKIEQRDAWEHLFVCLFVIIKTRYLLLPFLYEEVQSV